MANANSFLPDEMAEADVRFIEIFADGSSKETMIELHGGFMGLEQNPENFALTPKIGWKVEKKIDEEGLYLDRMKKELRKYGELHLNIKEIPEVLRLTPSRHWIYASETVSFSQIGWNISRYNVCGCMEK